MKLNAGLEEYVMIKRDKKYKSSAKAQKMYVICFFKTIE